MGIPNPLSLQQPDLGGLSANNSDRSDSVIEALPGTFIVRCTVTFKINSSGQRPAPHVLTLDVTVPKPDSFVATGLGVSTPLGQDCPITLQVRQGGEDAGYTSSAFAQEKITNLKIFDYQGNATPQNFDWEPTNANAPLADRFALAGGTGRIVDLKYYDDANRTGYATRPVGDTLETLTQGVRIKFTYADGTIDYADLGSTAFTFKKSGANAYEVD
jgi:hypothetical protein